MRQWCVSVRQLWHRLVCMDEPSSWNYYDIVLLGREPQSIECRHCGRYTR